MNIGKDLLIAFMIIIIILKEINIQILKEIRDHQMEILDLQIKLIDLL